MSADTLPPTGLPEQVHKYLFNPTWLAVIRRGHVPQRHLSVSFKSITDTNINITYFQLR